MASKIQLKTFGVKPVITLKHLEALRKRIRDECGIEPMFTTLRPRDIENLFDLYYAYVFGGTIRKECTTRGIPLKFESESRAKKFGGLFFAQYRVLPDGKVEYKHIGFRFPPQEYVSLFTKGEKKVRGAGLDIYDRLEALMIGFEHELIHMVQQLYGYALPEMRERGRKIVYDAHGYLFQCMVYQYFQHRDTQTSMHLGDAADHLTPSNLSKGKRVKVVNVLFHGKRQDFYGTIARINKKTAGITLDNGLKLNAPFGMLRKI